jgi:hypothetical protein
MLKMNDEGLDRLENDYPGIKKNILKIENTVLPACARCGSEDTAMIGVGIVGRSCRMTGATTKWRVIPNGPPPGEFFCNPCNEFFDPEPETTKESD